MPDVNDITVALDLDMTDSAAQARQIGEAWHDLSRRLEQVGDADGADTRLDDDLFRVLLNLYMVTDPWPLGQDEANTLRSALVNESRKRGYCGWTDAYHAFDPEASDA